jgi:hypothetical protein
LLFVGFASLILFNRCNDGDSALSQRSNKVCVHRVFVNVDTKSAHAAGSTISPLKKFSRVGFGFQICVNLFAIRMIVCQGGVDLCQRKMAEFLNNFLRNESGVVPRGDSTDRDAGARNAWTPTVDTSAAFNQAADLSDGGHCPNYIELGAGQRATALSKSNRKR